MSIEIGKLYINEVGTIAHILAKHPKKGIDNFYGYIANTGDGVDGTHWGQAICIYDNQHDEWKEYKEPKRYSETFSFSLNIELRNKDLCVACPLLSFREEPVPYAPRKAHCCALGVFINENVDYGTAIRRPSNCPLEEKK